MFSLASKTFPSCADYRGPTECFLGSCLCKENFCASEDQQSCVPQHCVPGGKPPPYEPTDWVKRFASYSDGAKFLPPDADDEQKLEWMQGQSTYPALLVAVGVVVGMLTMCCLCCPFSGGAQESARKHSQRPLRVGGRNDRYARLPKEELEDEPSVWPVLIVGVFMLVFNLVLVIQRTRTYAITTSVSDGTLEHLKRDSLLVAQQAGMINDTVKTLEYTLTTAPHTCQGFPEDLKTQMVNKTKNAISEYCDMAEELYEMVKPIPDRVDSIGDDMRTMYPMLKWGPLAPAILMTVVSAFIVMEAILTKACGTSTLAREEDCGLRVASVLFFLVIVLVACMSAMQVLAGITGSLFCEDVDNNVLSYVKHHALKPDPVSQNISMKKEMFYNMSVFYITGSTQNPLAPKVQRLIKYLKVIFSYYKKDAIQDNKEAPSSICQGLSNLSVKQILQPTVYLLHNASGLLRAANIYPYYHDVVHTTICGSFVETLGVTIFTQTIVGFVFFPACAILTHRFLGSWAAWKARAEEAREEFLSDMDEATGTGKQYPDHAGGYGGYSSDSDDEEDGICGFWHRLRGYSKGSLSETSLVVGGEARDSRVVPDPHWGGYR